MIQPPPNASQAHVVSFCAQLPDHADELDAIAVFRKIRKDSLGELYGWVRKDEIGLNAIAIRRMVTVQQLLHGLTGGIAQAVQDVAANTAAKLREKAAADPASFSAWCAVGFALHLYGDAHAHREMGGHGDDLDRMYLTGKGHAAHLTYPDRPLCAQLNRSWFNPWGCEGARVDRLGRFGSWKDYWKATPQMLASTARVDQKPVDGVVAGLLKIASEASILNDWGEKKMRRTLAQIGASEKTGEFLNQQGTDKSCETVLELALASGGPLAEAGVPAFKCHDAWNVYYEVVTAGFEQYPNARKKLGTEFKDVYVGDLWAPANRKP